MVVLDFEKSIFELEAKIKDLKSLDSSDIKLTDEIRKLELKLARISDDVYSHLTPWNKLQMARHPERPQSGDYIGDIITDFVPLAGDRLFGDDQSIVAGIGLLNGRGVAIIGHQKGREPQEKVRHNFGMPNPEGYRKAMRIMGMAARLHLPIITLIDTVGAFPGIEAEQRGQAEAIAKCLETGFNYNVPVISVVIGEGGSGGAIAIGVANTVMMLEYSVYSVISPEGCASILWKDVSFTKDAAEALRITAPDLLKLGVIDRIIKEPKGGAHKNYKEAASLLKTAIIEELSKLSKVSDYVSHREQRFLRIGR